MIVGINDRDARTLRTRDQAFRRLRGRDGALDEAGIGVEIQGIQKIDQQHCPMLATTAFWHVRVTLLSCIFAEE